MTAKISEEKRGKFYEKYGKEIINYDVIKLPMLSYQSREFFAQLIIAVWFSRNFFSRNNFL